MSVFPVFSPCTLCPRQCFADREGGELGVCRADPLPHIALYDLHQWEEPPISGSRGSGAVFFSHCSLGCIFCQNRTISHGGKGKPVTLSRLKEIFLELEARGAHNLNLVSGTHYLPVILRALEETKNDRRIPVVWNTGGYETAETITALAPYIDIWLPDWKYLKKDLAYRYSAAPDYPAVAEAAIRKMAELAPVCLFGQDGILKKGLIVRHLVLPGETKDSLALLSRMQEVLQDTDFRLSLMRQYTPEFLPPDCTFKNLRRRVTTYEYEKVVEHAVALGLRGFTQDASSATKAFTPQF